MKVASKDLKGGYRDRIPLKVLLALDPKPSISPYNPFKGTLLFGSLGPQGAAVGGCKYLLLTRQLGSETAQGLGGNPAFA